MLLHVLLILPPFSSLNSFLSDSHMASATFSFSHQAKSLGFAAVVCPVE